MLHRFREAVAQEEGVFVPSKRLERPKAVGQARTLQEAEHWRQLVFKEISQKVMKIQNRKSLFDGHMKCDAKKRTTRNTYGALCYCVASLTAFQVRQLNDEINELIQEKGRWEFRVKALGGKLFMVSRVRAFWGGGGGEIAH